MNLWVTVAAAVITGLVAMVGTLAATIIGLRNSHQAETAQLLATYHQLLVDQGAEITRLKERVAELETCLGRRKEGPTG